MVVSSTQGIRDSIAERLNELESDFTDTYNNWINLCLRDIQNSFPQSPILQTSADITLSSGTRIYALSGFSTVSGFEKMNTVLNPAASQKLVYLAPEEFDMVAPSATAGGNPNWYTIRGRETNEPKIEFYPVPNSGPTMHLDFQRTMDTVSSGSSVPQIPTRYFELPILFGEAKGLRRKGMRTEEKDVLNEYETLKQKMIQDLQRETTENKRIRGDRDFWNASRNSPDPIVNIYQSLY